MLIVVIQCKSLHLHTNCLRHLNFELLVGRPVGCCQALHLKFECLLLERICAFKCFNLLFRNHKIRDHTFEHFDLSQTAVDFEVRDHLFLCFYVFWFVLQQSPCQVIAVHFDVQVFVDQKREERNLLIDKFLNVSLYIFFTSFSKHLVTVHSQYFGNLVFTDIQIHEILVC